MLNFYQHLKISTLIFFSKYDFQDGYQTGLSNSLFILFDLVNTVLNQSGTGRKTFQQIWMEIPSNLTVSQF